MRTKLFLILQLFFFSLGLKAQVSQITFDFDYAQFGYDSVQNYLEFYYSFNQNSLTKHSTDSADYLDGILHIVLTDTATGTEVVNKEWRVTHQVTDSAAMQNKSLVGALGFLLPKGNYKAELTGYDYHFKTNRKTITEYFNVLPFLESDNPAVSDIQLSSRIIQDSENKNSIFYKNSMEIYPVPTSVFGDNQPVLFFYSEIYNVKSDTTTLPLKLSTILIDSRGNAHLNRTKNISRNVSSRVEVGSVPVNKLPTDTYTLILSVIDSAANFGVSSSKKFYVYNPDVQAADTGSSAGKDVLASEFGVMSEEELDQLFLKSKYVATSYEVDQFEKISTLQGKREFLYQFWKARDRDASTAKNEYYNEYMMRGTASNQRFGTISKVGWKSDRGRVYMIYGEPSEIERFPNQIDTKPYEIWYYNEIEGGVVFVFADLTGFSDYILVHSTMRGELRDDSWSRRISSF